MTLHPPIYHLKNPITWFHEWDEIVPKWAIYILVVFFFGGLFFFIFFLPSSFFSHGHPFCFIFLGHPWPHVIFWPLLPTPPTYLLPFFPLTHLPPSFYPSSHLPIYLPPSISLCFIPFFPLTSIPNVWEIKATWTFGFRVYLWTCIRV